MKWICIAFITCTHPEFVKASQSFRNHGTTTNFHQSGSKIPYQLFFEGLLHQLENKDDHSNIVVPHDMPIDIHSNDQVCVPTKFFKPCPVLFSVLLSVNPLAPSIENGKELFRTAINLCGQHLQIGCSTCSVLQCWNYENNNIIIMNDVKSVT